MYRFVLTSRWLGLGLLMTLAAVVMVGLGFWQLSRFHYRTAINDRIDAAALADPVPLTTVLTAPTSAAPGRLGPPAPGDAAWTRVRVSGHYDTRHEVLARGRTVDGNVGFEIVTPLILDDGTAVLVDRGWIAPPVGGGAATTPIIPAAPTGPVTVLGRVHAAESEPDQPETFASMMSVRRISPASLAPTLPYGVYGAYLTLDTQTPTASPAFVAVSPDHQDAAMNAGYVAQWWAFAVITMVGYGYLVVKEKQAQDAVRTPLPLDLAADPTPAAPARR